MAYLIVVAWDETFRPTKMNSTETLEEAQTIVEKVGGFYVDTPHAYGNADFMTVDPIAKTVSYDLVAEASAETDRATARVLDNRRSAYQAEADTLFFEEQAGEVDAGTWAAKRAEIKARFPK